MNTTQHLNPNNKCDRCEKVRELFYYDPTGEALCVKCTPGECKCGCGTPSYSTYRPGHDAKHVSVLISYYKAKTHTLDDLQLMLPSFALRNKLVRAINRLENKPYAGKNRCGCGRAPKTKNTNGQNPELCDICWDEAGWENDHMDGNHEQGERPDVCPMCR
jgi:hypothetical protein